MNWTIQEPKIELSPSRIPQSPSRRSGETPRLRTSQTTDSSLIESLASQQMRIPNLLEQIEPKITQLGKIYIFSKIPAAIVEYEEEHLQEFSNGFAKDEPIDFNYEEKQNLELQHVEYYHHLPVNNFQSKMTQGEIYIQEVLGLPKILTDYIFQRFLPDNCEFGDLSALYQRLKPYHPEERIYRLFGGVIKYSDVQDICMEVVSRHKEYEFVQPQIYQISFARAAAARLFYDADQRGEWALYYEKTHIKRGFSLLKQIFSIENCTDINNIDSYFGYEQFYVMYCVYCKYSRQNEIDASLSELQLRSYNDFQYSSQFIKRAFSGLGKRLLSPGTYEFEDFIQLFLSDICFDCEISNHYMFGIGDTNEDGYIDQADAGEFLDVQMLELEERGISVEYRDVLTEFHDMVKYSSTLDFRFSEKELLHCKMFMNFYDLLFSCEKFCQFENRDEYIGNVELEQNKIVKLHCDSGVWRAFWNAMYDQIAGD